MKTLLALLFNFIPIVLLAQGIVNNGGQIVSTTGTYITINGLNGNFINSTSGTDGAIDNDGIISLQGTWTNNASNNVFINQNADGKVIFNGSVTQDIAGTSQTDFESLKIDNTSGVTLQQSTVVSNGIALTNGPLTLNSNTININSNSAASVSRINGYIVSEQPDNSGKVIWNIGNNLSAHTFPFGTATGYYIPIILNLTAGDIGNATVSTYSTAGNNTPYPVSVTNMFGSNGSDNSANSVDRFWQIDKSGPGGIATLTFTAASSEVGAIVTLLAQRWRVIPPGWEEPLPGQTSTATSATVPGVSSFGPWAIAGNDLPLPIGLISFTATINNSHVDLSWETATELNCDYFSLEKTSDLINYETVTVIHGAGTSNKSIQYAASDNHPYSGLSYYQLTQMDFDGSKFTAPLVSVQINLEDQISVTPNPVSDGSITIDFQNHSGEVSSVQITDLDGRIIYASNNLLLNTEQSKLVIDNLDHWSKGVYFIRISTLSQVFLQKFVIN